MLVSHQSLCYQCQVPESTFIHSFFSLNDTIHHRLINSPIELLTEEKIQSVEKFQIYNGVVEKV